MNRNLGRKQLRQKSNNKYLPEYKGCPSNSSASRNFLVHRNEWIIKGLDFLDNC